MDHDRCELHKSSSACSGSTRWQPNYGSVKRGLNTKLHLAVDATGLPVRAFITEATDHDVKHAERLITNLSAKNLLADKAYDSQEFVDFAHSQKIKTNIPNRKNRVNPRPFDKASYKARHLVENAFLHLKSWRGLATRYAKKASSFLAIIQIKCLLLWA